MHSYFGERVTFIHTSHDGDKVEWEKILVVSVAIMAWIPITSQCCDDSNLPWMSFHATHDGAWKAHYHEIFYHGIREVL